MTLYMILIVAIGVFGALGGVLMILGDEWEQSNQREGE